MEDSTLTSLAREFREGSMQSFKRIVDAMTRSLIAFAYRYTRDWESARDLCQDTWLKVYEKISAYDPARSFSNWLFTIHRNGCLSYIRRASFRREVPEDSVNPERGGAETRFSDPYDKIEKQEFTRRLAEAMNHLSERQLLVFTRVDIEQRNQEEAARELGMNAATLRTTLHFARKRLAGLLKKYI